ncbi:MAG: hypothetical protein ACOVT5_05005 [Armatimonadaceae bacterium]|jgi:hypothetical protein
MLLDPRDHRLDDLLRHPLDAQDTIAHGPWHQTCSGNLWGFPETFLRAPDAFQSPLRVEIRADGEPVAPQAGIWRPSHVSRNARCAQSELQVVEDRFIAPDLCAVCAFWLRNPTDQNIAVEIKARWSFPNHNSGDRHHVRIAPAGDDLFGHLAGGARRLFTFAWSVAPSENEAVHHCRKWCASDNPVHDLLQAHGAQGPDSHPRFECDDPWLTRLVAHRLYRQSVETSPPPSPPNRDNIVASFTNGHFDRPSPGAPAWERWVAEILAGIEYTPEALVLRPLADAAGLDRWCLDNWTAGPHRICIAWDNPAIPEDAYHDGRRGFDVWIDGRHFHHADRPGPATIPWPQRNEW